MINYFNNDGSQSYPIFQPVFNYFHWFAGVVGKILAWKSKGLSEKYLATAKSGNSFAPKLSFIYDAKIATKFERNFLK